MEPMTPPDYAAVSSPISGGKRKDKLNTTTASAEMMSPPTGIGLLAQEATQGRRAHRRSKEH